MTLPERTPAKPPADAPEPEGEVVISGLDTGPGNAERGAPTPTESAQQRLPSHPTGEPEDEDG